MKKIVFTVVFGIVILFLVSSCAEGESLDDFVDKIANEFFGESTPSQTQQKQNKQQSTQSGSIDGTYYYVTNNPRGGAQNVSLFGGSFRREGIGGGYYGGKYSISGNKIILTYKYVKGAYGGNFGSSSGEDTFIIVDERTIKEESSGMIYRKEYDL